MISYDRLKKLIIDEIRQEGLATNEGFEDILYEKGGKYFVKREYRKRVKIGLTGGVFDGIHLGHVKMLYEAKSYVDILVVAVARDEVARKKRAPLHNQRERVELVNALKPVDLAIAGKEEKRLTIERVLPDIIFYGYDQPPMEFNYPAKFIRLTAYAPERLKTTHFRKL